MPEDSVAFVSRLITYLSGQNDYVSASEIMKDRLSGIHSEDELEPAIEKALPFLETREDETLGTLYRLSRSFDGYKSVFANVQSSRADVYNFLYSNYSNSIVNADFIKHALSLILNLPYFAEM
jgi:hypothetical protein